MARARLKPVATDRCYCARSKGAPTVEPMQGFNFTERVRKVLAMAREEARRLHHEYVGTEHILLALIREGEGVAGAVLRNLQVDLDEIQQEIERQVKKGKLAHTTGPDLPYTSRAKQVIELAMREARELKHSYVGTEHLLLGLLWEEKGIAAQVLTRNNADFASVREETLRVLGAPMPAPRHQVDSREGRTLRPRRFTLKVDCEGDYWFEEHFERAADAIAFLQTLSPRRPDRGQTPPPPNIT
jgi:ATP-dependent Clp protease ATP-binding subunit ClpC